MIEFPIVVRRSATRMAAGLLTTNAHGAVESEDLSRRFHESCSPMLRMEQILIADPDSDVLESVAKRDMTGALRCLMQRYGTAVYRYCREALRDAVLADDV